MTADNGSKSEDTTKDIDNVVSIDHSRFKKLDNTPYWNLFDDWNTLDVRVSYQEQLNSVEAVRYVTLTKYLMKNAHSEALQIRCRKIYERYMQGL